jgi:hypothetical protein
MLTIDRWKTKFSGQLMLALNGFGQDVEKQRSAEAGLNQHLVEPRRRSPLSSRLASGWRLCGTAMRGAASDSVPRSATRKDKAGLDNSSPCKFDFIHGSCGQPCAQRRGKQERSLRSSIVCCGLRHRDDAERIRSALLTKMSFAGQSIRVS